MAPTGKPILPRRCAVLLACMLALGACASSGSRGGYAGDNAEPYDYAARHERMLEVVLERPHRLEAYLKAREFEERRISRASWDRVMARREAFESVQRRQRQGDREQFQRLLEIQRRYREAHREDSSERWAQFLERNAPTGGAPANDAAAGAPAGGATP